MLSGTCHFIGLLLLTKAKRFPGKQKFFIINLSFTEMVLSWLRAVKTISNTVKQSFAVICIMGVLFLGLRWIILLMIVDRFLEIFWNVKYPIYIKKNFIMGLLASLWILSSVLVGTFALYRDYFGPLVYFFIGLVLDMIIVIVSSVTYIYFFLKVKKIRNQIDIVRNHRHKISTVAIKNFKIPLLMVLTYILFNVTGSFLALKASYLTADVIFKSLFLQLSDLLDICAFLSDVCIYVFLQRKILNILLSLFDKTRRSEVAAETK